MFNLFKILQFISSISSCNFKEFSFPIFSDNAPKLEAALHHAFEDKKVNIVNTRREFFNVTLDEIKKVVRENHDKTVEFIDVPPAEQYRESKQV